MPTIRLGLWITEMKMIELSTTGEHRAEGNEVTEGDGVTEAEARSAARPFFATIAEYTFFRRPSGRLARICIHFHTWPPSLS